MFLRAGGNCLGWYAIRISAYTQGITKLRHNMRGVSVVQADCIGEIGPSRRRKKNLGHLSRPAVKLGVNIFPGNCFAAVHVETRQPTLEFGLMRRG